MNQPNLMFYTKMKQPKPKPAASTPPKLALFARPPKPADTPGFPTPPLQTPATVPFQWEDAPGRPRSLATCPDHHKPKSVRSLDLPPRMLTSSCTPSPTLTMVLDSSPCDRTLSSTWSFRKLSAGRSEAGGGIKKLVMDTCKMNSKVMIRSSSPAVEHGTRSSWRWGGGSAKVNKEEDYSVDGFDIFDDHYNESADISTIDEVVKVKARNKVKRKGSFFSTRSHFWTRVQESVHEGLKQVVVPWRRSGRAGQHSK